MKKLYLLCLLALSCAAFADNVQTIALLEPRAGEGSENLSPMEKAMVRGELRKAIVNMAGYEAITRADIDQMMKEQNFQRTGMVSDDQIRQMGEMSGADYICVSTLTKSNTEFYLEAYLIHLESGRMSNPASQYGELTNGKFANMLPVCEALAQELLGVNNKAKQQTNSTLQTAQTQTPQSQTIQPGVKAETFEETMNIDITSLENSDSTIKNLCLDKSYSKECRAAGKKAISQTYKKNGKSMYQSFYEKAKKSGLSHTKAQMQAMQELSRIYIEAGNKAVLECSGGK